MFILPEQNTHLSPDWVAFERKASKIGCLFSIFAAASRSRRGTCEGERKTCNKPRAHQCVLSSYLNCFQTIKKKSVFYCKLSWIFIHIKSNLFADGISLFWNIFKNELKPNWKKIERELTTTLSLACALSMPRVILHQSFINH